jgi:Zn-dependent protease
MRWSFKVARIMGIDLKIHVTFFLIILLGAMQFSGHGTSGMLFGVLLMSLLFVCVTLHEFGHSVVAQRFGIIVHEIVLLPVGGVAMLARNPDKPMQELLIALAGPAVNVVIALGLGTYLGLYSYASGLEAKWLLQAASAGPSWQTLLVWLLNANVALVVFNMIPAFPMDGGRVLRGILGFFMRWGTATRIADCPGCAGDLHRPYPHGRDRSFRVHLGRSDAR